MSATARRPGDRPAPVTVRRQQLFDALVALFLAEGFARFTLDDLAVRLRCSKSTLYQLAGSKEQLSRAVAVHFFRGAAERVEARLVDVAQPGARVDAYLRAVASELAPASSAFFADLESFAPGREVYRRNTAIAAVRVGELIADGVRTGELRAVSADLVADLVAAQMVRIQQREVYAATGTEDAEAYAALADLVVHGISS